MEQLVLFVTQAEGGAPGYLSQLGEDGALSLAETLTSFLDNLGLDLASGSEHRMRALQSPRPEGMTIEEGLRFAREVCPDVLVCCGPSVRSQKTLAPFVESLALPTVLVESLDVVLADVVGKDLGPAAALPLSSGLERVFQGTRESGPLPRLVLVQTSLEAFAQWLPRVALDQGPVAEGMLVSLREVSESDRVPALAALGFNGPWPGRWILDPGT